MSLLESTALKSFISGASSGMITCVIFQPMDLVKTRLQVTPSLITNLGVPKQVSIDSAGLIKRSCIIDTIINVVRSESYTGLWNGLKPSLCRTVPGVGMYFFTLNTLKSNFGAEKSSPLANMAFGFTARSFVGTAMLPISVIKTRYESGCFGYRTVPQALTDIWKLEGARGMFSGWTATIARDAPYSGLYYMFYAQQRNMFSVAYGRDLTARENFSCGILSGLLACLVTQPADVVKTKLQLNPHCYRSTLDCLLNVIKSERGVLELFRGLLPRSLRKSLISALSWTLFEEIMKINKNVAK